jgi:heme A synthase
MENRSMTILLGFVGMIGGVMTLALLRPYSALLALFSMPFGASTLVLALSILMALRNLRQTTKPEVIHDQPDALSYEAS